MLSYTRISLATRSLIFFFPSFFRQVFDLRDFSRLIKLSQRFLTWFSVRPLRFPATTDQLAS